MQKVLKFLERNVQWIALGLGVLFLLWTVYAYMFNAPVTVSIPAVDTAPLTPEDVDVKIAEKKGHALEMAMKRSDTIDLPKIDVLSPYLAKLDQKDSKVPAEIAGGSWSGTRGQITSYQTVEEAQAGKVTTLPTLPAAKYIAESHDITSVELPGNAQPPANGGGAAVQPVMARQDVRWVSLKYKVPMSDLRDQFVQAFGKVGIQTLFVSRFVQVELLRQEKLGPDKWSEAKPVKAVVAAEVPNYPGDEVDPEDQNLRNIGFQYKDALKKLDKDIIAVPFPAIAPGAPPAYAPGQSRPVRAAAGKAPVAAQRNPAGQPARPGQPPVAGAPAPVANAGGQGGQVAAGEFDLSAAKIEDREITVHDLTAEDGKTYRYAIVYKVANPLWFTQNISSPQLSKKFALVSPPSEWSKEIEIPNHTRIFVMNVNKPTSKVTFDLFEWKDTGYHENKKDAYPGDTIDKWTVVDIRNDKDSSVLVLDNGGKLDVHSKRTDSQDPSYQELKTEAEQPVAAAVAR